jgi:hypothetical protein
MTAEAAKGPPPDCHRMVIRLRYGVKGGCDRRTTSTGETCWVNGHAKPPLTPPLQRIGRQQSVRWGRSAAPQDHGRAEPGLRTTDPCPRDAPEPPSTASDHHLQQPANMKLGRAFNPRAAHENTLVMRRSSPSDTPLNSPPKASPCPSCATSSGTRPLPPPSLSAERRAPAPASGSADLGLARRPGIARRSAPGAAGDVPDRHRFFGDLIQDPVPADP